MANFPQDVLDSTLSHITDTRTLSQCALASRVLLYQTRCNQFSNGAKITSRNRKLVADILYSTYFFIPPHSIRAVEISGIQFTEDVGHTEGDTSIFTRVLNRISRLQMVRLEGVHWLLSAVSRDAISIRLPSVTHLDLNNVVLSSQDQMIEIMNLFPSLSHLLVQRVDLFIPPNLPRSSSSVRSLVPLVGHPPRELERLELFVDDSDALFVVQAVSNRFRFSHMVLWRSPFDESITTSCGSLQNDILRNMAEALVHLEFIISGFNAVQGASPSPYVHLVAFSNVRLTSDLSGTNQSIV